MKLDTWFFAAFMSVFYVAGLGIIGYALWCVQRSAQAAAWPTTAATDWRLQADERASQDRRGQSNIYEVKIQYSYAVEGVNYEGTRLAFGYAGSNRPAPHGDIHRKLEAAKGIDVRYNPKDPSESCLSFGLHRSVQFMLCFGASILIFAVAFTLMSWLSTLPDNVLLSNLSVR
jgi:Protein of unknown function (DUF3592)